MPMKGGEEDVRSKRLDKSSVRKPSARKAPKGHSALKRQQALEHEHGKLFSPISLPYQGIYTDEDSLEQPSAFKLFPTTASPGAATPVVRPDAELE